MVIEIKALESVWVQILPLLHISCGALGELFNFSVL